MPISSCTKPIAISEPPTQCDDSNRRCAGWNGEEASSRAQVRDRVITQLYLLRESSNATPKVYNGREKGQNKAESNQINFPTPEHTTDEKFQPKLKEPRVEDWKQFCSQNDDDFL